MRTIIFIIVMYTSACFGQEKIITGRVTNIRNQPMNGVEIYSKPSNTKVKTDTYGNYTLRTSLGETIRLKVDDKFEKFWVNDIGYNSYTNNSYMIGTESIVNLNWRSLRYDDRTPNNDFDEPYTVRVNIYKVTQQDLDSTYTAIINDSLVKRAKANNFKDITVFYGENYSTYRFACMFYCKEISGKVKKELLLKLIKEQLAHTKEFPLGQPMRGNDRIMMGGDRANEGIGNRRNNYIIDKPEAIKTAIVKNMGVRFAACMYYVNGRKYLIKSTEDAEKVIRKIRRLNGISIGLNAALDNYYGRDGIMGTVLVTKE